MWQALVGVLVTAVAFLLAGALVPGVKVRNFGAAVVAALVYGVVHFLLHKLLIFLAFPLIVVTLGLFMVVINVVLLWLTTKLVKGIEIEGFMGYLFTSLIMSGASILFGWLAG